MPDISSSLSKREVNARQNTYTKSEIDIKDGAIQAIAEAAQTTADAAEKKNQEQDQLIAELQRSSHSHSNQAVLDKTEQPYTTAERDKLAGLENYTHPNYTAHAKGFYKFASDGEGHVTDAEKVTKEDITALGIPGSIPIYNVDVDEEYGYSEGMIIATIVVNQTAHTIGVPIIGENENADYGLMSASDKTKLDGISDNANNYVHPTTSGNKHIPSGGSSGQILRWSADGTAVWGADNNTTYSDATQSTHGLMTAADKKKLDGMDLSKYLPKDGTAVAAAKMSTARKINKVAFDGTKDITIPRSRSLVHQAKGTNGSTGYVAVATLTVKATYCNLPGFIRYRNRGRAIVDLTFRFKNAGTNDPELDFARMDFDVNAAQGAYLSKSGTGTWVLYIAKSEAYDEIEIMDCQPPTGIDIAFTNAHASSLPSGTVAFTQHNRANESSTVAAAKTLTDSGWIATTRSTTFTATSAVKCRKYGQLVEVRGEVTFSSTYGSPTVCTLPAGYRPATVVQACGITPSGKQYMIKADTSGVISFGSDSGSTFVKGTTYRVDLTYLLG